MILPSPPSSSTSSSSSSMVYISGHAAHVSSVRLLQQHNTMIMLNNCSFIIQLFSSPLILYSRESDKGARPTWRASVFLGRNFYRAPFSISHLPPSNPSKSYSVSHVGIWSRVQSLFRGDQVRNVYIRRNSYTNRGFSQTLFSPFSCI